MSNDEHASLHLLIEGKVQEVGFRYFVQQCVGEMNIRGWVRNIEDGRVEVLTEGQKADLEILLANIKRGNAISRISNIVQEWEIAKGNMTGFEILATASSSR